MRVIRTFRGDERRRGTEAGRHVFVARVVIEGIGSVKKQHLFIFMQEKQE